MEEKIHHILTIREQVANIVRKKIVMREFRSGERITERAVSEMLNVSTTPVKEAFRMLVAEGLLVVEPRKGTFVSEFSEQKFTQAAYLRGAVEGVAAKFAAEAITAEEINEMYQTLEKSRECIEIDDAVGLIEAHVRFHEILRNASRNSYLITLLLTMRTSDYAVLRPALATDKETRLLDHKDHYEIWEALKARDSERAEMSVRKHVQRANEYALTRPSAVSEDDMIDLLKII